MTIPPKVSSRVRAFFWVATAVLGFLQAWDSRNEIINDTISYLDMGDAVFHGDWHAAFNGLWSPLYALLLGAANYIFRPSPFWGFPLVHAVGYLIYLFAFCCFDFLLLELIRSRDLRANEVAQGGGVPASSAWLVIGYTLFLWCGLDAIGLYETNPDMLVAAFVFLAAGLVLRIRNGTAMWKSYGLLGIALGLAYLTKAAMFPISFLFLGVAFLAPSDRRRFVPQGLLACVAFFVLSTPFIVGLSQSKGHFTFGESGRYNYAVHVNHVQSIHWQGSPPGFGTPVHPTRKVFDAPATYEFGTPYSTTYAPWYDLSYWYDGVTPRFSVRDQVAASQRNLAVVIVRFFGLNCSVLAALLFLYYASFRAGNISHDVVRYWFLVVPAIAAIGLYMLVWVEPRYIAPFVVLIELALFFGLRIRESSHGVMLESAAAVLLIMFLSPWGPNTIPKHSSAVADVFRHHSLDSNPWAEVAVGLRTMGIQPGDRVASLEYSNLGNVKWARLAKVRIVAEVNFRKGVPASQPNNFWAASASTQEQVLQALAKTGARIVVSDQAPMPASSSDWRGIGETGFFALWLTIAPNE
jgi:hypothetical protein